MLCLMFVVFYVEPSELNLIVCMQGSAQDTAKNAPRRKEEQKQALQAVNCSSGRQASVQPACLPFCLVSHQNMLNVHAGNP